MYEQASRSASLLEVGSLTTVAPIGGAYHPVVDHVSFSVRAGERVGIVGESGSGKSMLARSILRLQDASCRVRTGSVMFDGQDILALEPHALRRVRGGQIAMIFQEPMASLNPVVTVGEQVGETLRLHESMNRRQARKRTVELFDEVGLPDPPQRLSQYPFQMSGGMLQRVMIAQAIAAKPSLLIADEPTTALDVTTQAQILDLLRSLSVEYDMSVIIISHDFGVIADVADRVLVMYAGRIVERGYVDDVLTRPVHPYTEKLLESTPRLGDFEQEFARVSGTIPPPNRLPRGCAFHPRCERVMDHCRDHVPPEISIETARKAACWLWDDDVAGPRVDVAVSGPGEDPHE